MSTTESERSDPGPASAAAASLLPRPTTSSAAIEMMDIDDLREEEEDSKPSTITNNHKDKNNIGHDEDEDDDDEIVQEIPVYLSPALSQNLRLIQFPLLQTRQDESSASASTTIATQQPQEPTEVRLKSKHYMMEVDYETPNAIDCQGNYSMSQRTYSSHTVPIATHMALGKLLNMGMDNRTELHLVPLAGILQLRPNFNHVDQETAREESDEAMLEQQEESEQQNQNSQNNDRKQPIGLQKKESERAALARKSSYAFKRSSEESEVWQVLKIHSTSSQQAQDLVQQVTTSNHYTHNRVQPAGFNKNRRNHKTTTAGAAATSSASSSSLNEQYVNSLNYLPAPPKRAPDDRHQGNLQSPYANGGHIRSAPIDMDDDDDDNNSNNNLDPDDPLIIVKKLVNLMKSGSPMPYSVLRVQFPTTTISDAALLHALGSCAVLVRGNFCLASRLLGMPPHMAQARTFVLFLLQSLGVVHRPRLEHVFASRNATTTAVAVESNGSTATFTTAAATASVRNGQKNNDSSLLSPFVETVTPAMLELLLHQVARRRKDDDDNGGDGGGGWILKVEEDVGFGERHPETLLQHLQHWATLMANHFGPWLERYRE